MTTPTPPSFVVVTDGGLDAFSGLLNDVPVAPFSVNFGSQSYRTFDISREQLFRELQTNPVHPTSSQPSPQDWLSAFEAAGGQGAPETVGTAEIVAVTVSAGLSGSRNAAEQALGLWKGAPVHLHDSQTLSAGQAFQVHAARTAAQRGESAQTALEWMKQVHAETELYFTIETLEYLRRGGRIGRVQATLGGLLNLKPVITVDKTTGQYTNVGRARSYRGAIEAVAAQVTHKYGRGTPLRVGLLYGNEPADADLVLEFLRASHPILWSEAVGINPVLNIHTGPRALGLAAAPGVWPWER